MVLDRRASVNRAAANSLLSPGKQISAKMSKNVSLAAADSAAILDIGYPMGFNDSTGKHAPWMAPDPTVSVITLTGATGGTFTITVNGVATGALAWNASIVVVAAALKAIGFVATVALNTLVYTITFDGQAEIATLPTVSADLSGITGDLTEGVTVNDGTAQEASPTVLNISLGQDVPATGGDYTITYGGNTTSAIAIADNAAEIKAHILAIGSSPPANVSVERTGLADIKVTFDDIADLLSLPTVSATVSGLTGDTASGSEATAGDVLSLASASDIEIDVGSATGGTFTVTVNGSTTAAIAFDAAVGAVDSALLAIGFTVSTALVSTTYTITFSGKDEVITLPTLSGSIIPLTGAVVDIVTTAGEATNGTNQIRGFINPNQTQVGTKTGTITLSRTASATAVATQSTPHGLVTGMSLAVSGASDADYNTTATITVTSEFTFTYTALGSDTDTDSGTYTTTNETMAMMMTEGTISASLPEGLVASSDVTALRTALKDNLFIRSIYVQGLAGVN